MSWDIKGGYRAFSVSFSLPCVVDFLRLQTSSAVVMHYSTFILLFVHASITVSTPLFY